MAALVGCSYSDETTTGAHALGYTNCTEPDRMFIHSPFVCHSKQVVYYITCTGTNGVRQNLVACCNPIIGCQLAVR